MRLRHPLPAAIRHHQPGEPGRQKRRGDRIVANRVDQVAGEHPAVLPDAVHRLADDPAGGQLLRQGVHRAVAPAAGLVDVVPYGVGPWAAGHCTLPVTHSESLPTHHTVPSGRLRPWGLRGCTRVTVLSTRDAVVT